jgi:uncharacterized membrane protein
MAAMRLRGVEASRFAPVWWCLAAGLFFLGVNKQLNLQTLLIVLGRRVAVAGHWYARRRQAQMIFILGLGLAVTVFLVCFIKLFSEFALAYSWAAAGIITLVLFVLLRAATINHADSAIGMNLHDDQWAWVLEIMGSVAIATAALRTRNTGISPGKNRKNAPR